MYGRRRMIFSGLLLLIALAIGTEASNVVEMCSDISESNELQISVECLQSLVGLENEVYREPKEFMAALQRVERMIKQGKSLSSDENIIWVMVRDKIRTMVIGGMSRVEFHAKDGDSAICAIVTALGYRYGFCTYLQSLGLSESNFASRTVVYTSTTNNVTARSTNILPGLVLRSSVRTTTTTDPPLVIHLDLFNMKCDSAALQSLCSEYCCGTHQADTIFCNSQLPCY